MGLESYSNEDLLELGKHIRGLKDFWVSPEGNELRQVMSALTEQYMREIMDGDPHAFRAVRAVHDLAKELGDQVLYEKAVRNEFERRFMMNGGRS